MHATESYRTSTKKQLRNAYYKITPNLLFEYQCTSVKFIRLPNRIESKLFLPELECSTTDFGADQSRTLAVWRTPGSVYWYSGTPRSHTEFNGNDDNNKDSDETNERWTDMSKLQYEF